MLFCWANCFNFQSNHDNFSCGANCFKFHSNQDSVFVKHIKFEKCKELKKKTTEELMPASRVASQKMVELLGARGWEKNRTEFYWVMLLIYTIWEYWNPCDAWYGSKIIANSSNFSLFWFWYKCTKIYTWKYLKQ